MNVHLISNDIKEISKLSKADNISVIVRDNTIYVVAHDQKDTEFKGQVIMSFNATYGEEGQTLISKDVLKLIPKDVLANITEDTIFAGNRKIKYVSNDLIDEPIQVENYLTTIEGKELDNLLSGYYAMATDMTRPILASMCIDKNNFVALDGFRLAVRTGKFESREQVVIDINMVNTLKKIKFKGEVKVYYNDRHVKFIFGNLEVMGNRIQGDYIKYNSIIPHDYNTKVEIETKQVIDILKDYKKNKFELVKLNFDKSKLIIEAENKTSKVEETVNIKTEGKPLEIAFNINYLIDSLNSYDNATFELSDRVSPLVIKENNKLDLVLPVRISIV